MQTYSDYMTKLIGARFSAEALASVSEEAYFVDMMRDDVFDDDDVLIAEAPKIYEDGGGSESAGGRGGLSGAWDDRPPLLPPSLPPQC